MRIGWYVADAGLQLRNDDVYLNRSIKDKSGCWYGIYFSDLNGWVG